MSNGTAQYPPGMDPRSRLSGPATGLLVTGIVGGVFSVISLVWGVMSTGLSPLVGDDVPEVVEGLVSGAISTISAVLGILLAGLLVYASMKMREPSQYGLCIVASVIAMVPCVSPCCLIGLPVGIWCMVMLTKPEIKDAFR